MPVSDKIFFYSVDHLKEIRHKIVTAISRIDITADQSGMVESLFLECIKPILDVYEPMISPLASHYGNRIFRARKCINNVPFTDLKDLYNRPTPSGRALTRSNIPTLYASSSSQTSLFEIDPKIGELICITQFDYSQIMEGNFWFVGQLASFQKSQESSRYLGNKNVVEKPAYFPNKAIHSWTFKDSLFNEIFSTLSTQSNDYALNQLILEEMLNTQPKDTDFHGVVFLSVKHPPGTNFAIYGDSIKKLEPKIVNLVRVTDVDDYGFVATRLLKNAKPKNGLLDWPEYEHPFD